MIHLQRLILKDGRRGVWRVLEFVRRGRGDLEARPDCPDEEVKLLERQPWFEEQAFRPFDQGSFGNTYPFDIGLGCQIITCCENIIFKILFPTLMEFIVSVQHLLVWINLANWHKTPLHCSARTVGFCQLSQNKTVWNFSDFVQLIPEMCALPHQANMGVLPHGF